MGIRAGFSMAFIPCYTLVRLDSNELNLKHKTKILNKKSVGILNKYNVTEITTKKTEEWLLNKHYAKRKCNVMKSFALVENEIIVGVATFGMPPTPFFSKLFDKGTYIELNRLITNDGLDKNAW